MSKRRVLFIASTGGHLKELMQLESMFDNYDFNLITEKTKSNMYLKEKFKNLFFFISFSVLTLYFIFFWSKPSS